MTNAQNAYITTINIKEVTQKPKNKAGKDWWSVLTHDDEYYSVVDPMIVAQLAPGMRSVSVVDKATNDKVFHNIVGIALPGGDIATPEMAAIMPGNAVPQPQPAQPQPKPQQSAPAAAPVQTSQQMSAVMEVRSKALELAVRHSNGDNSNLALYRDAFYNYIVNGASEQQNSSEGGFNDFIANAEK